MFILFFHHPKQLFIMGTSHQPWPWPAQQFLQIQTWKQTLQTQSKGLSRLPQSLQKILSTISQFQQWNSSIWSASLKLVISADTFLLVPQISDRMTVKMHFRRTLQYSKILNIDPWNLQWFFFPFTPVLWHMYYLFCPPFWLCIGRTSHQCFSYFIEKYCWKKPLKMETITFY